MKLLVSLLLLISAVFPLPTWHEIKAGDTLFDLSVRYGTTISTLTSLNPTISPRFLQIGTRVLVNDDNLGDNVETTAATGQHSDYLESKTATPVHHRNNLLSFQEFEDVMACRGGSVQRATQDQYQSILKHSETLGGISSKRELAMFLTHILHESDGLKAREEYFCAHGANRDICIQRYGQSKSTGHTYHGRGYIQTTHIYNYRAFSQSYFNDDRLVEDPSPVSLEEDLAWASAFFYWKTAVHPVAITGEFGRTTFAINGALECKGNSQSARQGGEFTSIIRFKQYQKILLALGIYEAPNAAGCTP